MYCPEACDYYSGYVIYLLTNIFSKVTRNKRKQATHREKLKAVLSLMKMTKLPQNVAVQSSVSSTIIFITLKMFLSKAKLNKHHASKKNETFNLQNLCVLSFPFF